MLRVLHIAHQLLLQVHWLRQYNLRIGHIYKHTQLFLAFLRFECVRLIMAAKVCLVLFQSD